mmetsp:Transcript_21561/g.18590  ORF Transcript_21561/g.18590 Transcript_21561/m.18590 type:complete len:317 (+) Transcript_21561:76-1026(+)
MFTATSNFLKKSSAFYSITRNFSQIKIPLPEYQVHNFNIKDLPTETTTNKEELLEYYKDIAGLRRMEVTMDNLYKQREIRGFCHLYDGQEAICLGIEKACNLDDCLITAYRDHCQARVRGYSVHQIMAEMMGKKTGATKGKGGSMHFYRKAGNFYGGHGIVGAQTPMGVGLAFALKYKQKPNIAITMYGDGASNQGQLFEGANIAKLWNLPCIFICENNQFGMGTSNERASANTTYFKKLDMANVPGMLIDGHNVFAVREGMRFAKKYAIENGPVCIEMKTYRYHGHSMSDPGVTYRTREDVSNIRKTKDCVNYIK